MALAFKKGDKVKVTKVCTADGGRWIGKVGVVTSYMASLPFPYSVEVEGSARNPMVFTTSELEKVG